MSDYSPLPASTLPSLASRPPGYQLMVRVIAEDERSFPRSRFQRLIGTDPLSVEARAWYLGVLGEQEVARYLDKLGPGWTILHSVPIGQDVSDIDHIVIGPPGVFTINAKNHPKAKIWVSPKLVMVAGQKTDYLRNSRFEATRASELLSAAIGQAIIVRPIIAIVGASQLTVRGRPVDVEVTRASALVNVLKRLKPALTPQQVAIVASTAESPRTWKQSELSSVDPAELSTFARIHAEVVTAKNHRDIFSFLSLLAAAIGVVSVLWFVLAQIANSLSTTLSGAANATTSTSAAPFSVATWWPLIALAVVIALVERLAPRRRRRR